MVKFNELNIQLIRVPLPFRLDHVNCFLAKNNDGKSWTLIDTGLYNKETIAIWDELFQTKNIERVIISHEHPDHIGNAGYLQQKYNVDIYMTKRALQFNSYFIQKQRLQELNDYYKASGVSQQLIDDLIKANKKMIHAIYPLTNEKMIHFLNEGDELQIGNLKYNVIFTPGHADGLFTLYSKENNVLLSTDHILPKITPNVSYWFFGEQNPLHLYIQSLEKLKKLNANLIIPSHGKPFYDANNRIDEIITHHNERLEHILSIIKREEKTVFEITNEMFTKNLTTHEMRFAIGEAIAHLEYLRFKNLCKQEYKNGIWYYQTI